MAITLQNNSFTLTANLSGVFDSANPDGTVTSGGDAAFGWSAPNGLVHGKAITLSTNTSFPAKTQATAAHWQNGSDIKLNGTPVVDEGMSGSPSTSIWGGLGDFITIETGNLRHTRTDKIYRGVGAGSLVDSKAFDGKVGDQSLYLSFWTWMNMDNFRGYLMGYDSLSGSFNITEDLSTSEAVTITYLDESVHTGIITKVNTGNSRVTLTVVGGSLGAALSEGATCVGDVSGASIVLRPLTFYGTTGATKTCRIYQDDSSNQRTVTTTSCASNGVMDADYYDASGVVDHDSGLDTANVGYPVRGREKEWVHYELEVDFTGASGYMRHRINGDVVEVSQAQPVDRLSSTSSFKLSNIGLDTNGITGSDFSDLGLRQDFGEIYSDTGLLRVVIGDAATLTDCTHVELQEPQVWGTDITLTLNQGSFTSFAGKYIFLVEAGFTDTFGAAL